MKLGTLFLLSAASLIIIAGVGQISKSRDAVNASVPISLTSTDSLTKSVISQNPAAIKSGTFVSGEHTTQGTVRITNKNGKSIIQLDQSFKTSTSGPDLVVVLHRSNNVIGSTKPPAHALKRGDYIVIAPLKKYSGAQSYTIPNNINLGNYQSVAIWCRRFNATFGAAKLSS
jgi:hypothetical protein